MILGIDLSRHNRDRGEIDFDAVREDGYKYVILKLTEGVDYIDPWVHEMAPAVKEAGLLLGYYHFATPGGSKISGGYKKWWDAQDELDDFLAALQDVPKPDLKIALDFEWSHIEETLPNHPDRTRWAVEWILGAETALGYKPLFYTYKSYMKHLILPDETLNACPLWYARYSDDDSLDPDWGWGRYEAWQNTSSGEVAGITGNVDLNESPHGLDEMTDKPCGMPMSAQIRQHIANINKELGGLAVIADTLEEQGQ